jgi:hypothetical protein
MGLKEKKVKKKGKFFLEPAQNGIVAGGCPTQSQWMNCPPTKTRLVESWGLVHSSLGKGENLKKVVFGEKSHLLP